MTSIMGYSKLYYEDYIDNVDYWYFSLGVKLPKWADAVSRHGGKGISALDFYGMLFEEDLEPSRMPEDYRTGEYGAIALELVPNPNKGVSEAQEGEPVKKRKGRKKTKREPDFIGKRRTITDGCIELFDMIDESENFCMMSPISYAGCKRTIENARYLYAMIIEIDGLIEKDDDGIDELFYSWERKELPNPRPTFVVCSGNGVHLYYVFERPIPLWSNVYEQLNKARQELVPRLWNTYVSKEKIQYESVAQGFRIVGTRAKEENVYVMAFEVGPKVSIEYMNSFIWNDENKILNYYKSKMSLEEAKKRYPEWYQRRIEGQEKKNHFKRNPAIYHNWIKKIMTGATVGHRYNCMEALCALAVQCDIPPEEVESDCRMLMARFEMLTEKENNHFTEYDVLCALKTYHRADQKAYERKVEIISKKTGIELKRAKRNYQKQEWHLEDIRSKKENMKKRGQSFKNPEGRPKGSGTAEEKVREWRLAHPEGRKADCIRDTGLSKPTVYKWWK